MNERIKKFRDSILTWLPLIIQIFSLLFAFYIYLRFDKTNKELSNNKLEIETKLMPREFENNLRLTLFKEVKDAIGQKDTTLQHAILVIVNDLLEEDSVFRIKLINILLQSAANPPELQQTQNNLTEYKQEQNSINPRIFTIDVFYLEDVLSEAEPRAEAICSLLRSKYPKYTVRKRLLPKSINARIGYQIDSNQIRYDIGSEEERLAKEIFNDILNNNIFKKEQPILKGIANNTKNYMSIFVRNM